MKIYSCDQMRQIEENANRQGMSFTDMMEKAGIACFKEICSIIGNSDKKNITVLCGSGKTAVTVLLLRVIFIMQASR